VPAAAPELDRVFAALADPTRRAIVARLAGGAATVGELARPFAISQPAVSRHLRVLEEAGLIEAGRSGAARPRQLRAEALSEVAAWLEPYRALWEKNFERLDGILDEMQAAAGPSPAETGENGGDTP
jgi:DNA-binding transcriptional ArsR family regulator